MCTPAVLTCARTQALMACWQCTSHAPYSQLGAMPSWPGNGIGLPDRSFMVIVWPAGSAQRTMYEKVFCPSVLMRPLMEERPLIEERPLMEERPLIEERPFSEAAAAAVLS